MILLKVAISEKNYGIVWRNPSDLCYYGVWSGYILETSGCWRCWLWTIIWPPPHLAERDKQLGHTPTTSQNGSSLLDGIWNGVVVAMQHSYTPQSVETDAQLRHPPHRPGEGSLATHPPELGSSHTRLHSRRVRNEPSPRLSCHYWLLRQSYVSIGKSVLVEAVLLLGGCWGICCLFCLEGDFQ